jgi:uncharacterized protein RhaS with RHS repeats
MRDYDPTTGRYLEPDPLGLVDGASVYGYARQNPGRYIDPRGEDTYLAIFPDAARGYGHIGISTDLGGGAEQTEGYYCSQEGLSCFLGAPGEVRPDNMSFATSVILIPMSPQKTAQVQNCIDRRRDNPGQYNLIGRSCVDFARDCLREAGEYIPGSAVPNRVYEDYRNQSRPVPSKSHPQVIK